MGVNPRYGSVAALRSVPIFLLISLQAQFVAASHAQTAGWYLGGSIPVMFIDASKTKSTGEFLAENPARQLDPSLPQFIPIGYEATVDSSYDTGFKFGGVLGYEFGSGLRIEGEVFHARASVNKLTYGEITSPVLTGSPESRSIPVSGSATQLGAMTNVWMDLSPASKISPYIGVGAGYIRINQGSVKYDSNALAEIVAKSLDPTSELEEGFVPELSAAATVRAFHVGVGISFALSDSMAVQLGYRVQNTSTLKFTGKNSNASVEATTKLRTQFLELGVRVRF